MPTKSITNWETWKELCENNNLDPYKTIEFGLDMGGGNSLDYEFIADIPKEKKKELKPVFLGLII